MATDRPHIPMIQPHSPTRMGWGTGVQPPSARRLGRGNAHRSFPPPGLTTRALYSSHSRPRSWPGQSPGRTGGVRVGEGAAAAAAARCVHSAPTGASQLITHSQRALSPRATCVVNPDTSSATAPTKTLSRRQRQYRDERKVPVSTDNVRVHLRRHGC